MRSNKDLGDFAAQTQDATKAIQKASEGISKLNLLPTNQKMRTVKNKKQAKQLLDLGNINGTSLEQTNLTSR